MPTRKPTIKRAVKVLVLACFVIGLGLLATSSKALTQSDNARSIFTEAEPPISDIASQVEWLMDGDKVFRPTTDEFRDQLALSWAGAFAEIDSVTVSEDGPLASSYVSGPSLDGLTTETDFVSSEQLSHTLQLTFLSADGQVARVSSTETVQSLKYKVNDLEANATVTETYDAILLLEDGNWRIRHLVRTSSDLDWAN